jgi:hypothetical protein
MELVTVVNRTDKPLEAMWDGKIHVIPVGKSMHNRYVAQKAKEQNVLMGSQDPRTGDIVYLVGIEEDRDDLSPVNTNIANPTGERWNRNYLPGGQNAVQVVPGRAGLFARDIQAGLTPDTAFTVNTDSGKIPDAKF